MTGVSLQPPDGLAFLCSFYHHIFKKIAHDVKMAANHSVSTKMAAPSGGALNSNTKSIF
jgi:hypothetical protein